MIRLILATLCAFALTACASMDAAHIAGQNADATKYQHYSDVELAKQTAVASCFARAGTDNQIAMCALYGQGVGMASTFGGRPTGTTIAPTTMQAVGDTLKAVAPYGAAAAIASSVTSVQTKDPAPPLVVRPEVVNPVVITP